MVPHPLRPREWVIDFAPSGDGWAGRPPAVTDRGFSRVTPAAACTLEYHPTVCRIARSAEVRKREEVRKEIGGLGRIHHRPKFARSLRARHPGAVVPTRTRKRHLVSLRIGSL